MGGGGFCTIGSLASATPTSRITIYQRMSKEVLTRGDLGSATPTNRPTIYQRMSKGGCPVP